VNLPVTVRLAHGLPRGAGGDLGQLLLPSSSVCERLFDPGRKKERGGAGFSR
jgi:hypothetical protein